MGAATLRLPILAGRTSLSFICDLSPRLLCIAYAHNVGTDIETILIIPFDCRLLSLQIQTKLLRAEYLPTLLQAIRTALFPENALAEARVPPTADQVDEIKRLCADTIIETVPEPLRIRFFATADTELMRQDVEGTLDLFADSYLNKHLIISIVELLVSRLFPELSEGVNND